MDENLRKALLEIDPKWSGKEAGHAPTDSTEPRRTGSLMGPEGVPMAGSNQARGRGGVLSSVTGALEGDAEGSLSSVARRLRCNRRTVGRLVRWVGAIDTVESAEEKCTLVEPATITPAAPPPYAPPRPDRPPFALEILALAGHLVRLLEHLASLLRGRGVALEQGPGLAALLRSQFDHWGEVFHVTGRAPPQLRIPWPPGTPAS